MKRILLFCWSIIFVGLIFIFCACENPPLIQNKTLELAPPPPFPEFDTTLCNGVKEYCYPSDTADYKFVKYNFFKKKNGTIYRLVFTTDVLASDCCKAGYFFDSTMGYQHYENNRKLDDVIDLESYREIKGSNFSADKNNVYY